MRTDYSCRSEKYCSFEQYSVHLRIGIQNTMYIKYSLQKAYAVQNVICKGTFSTV